LPASWRKTSAESKVIVCRPCYFLLLFVPFFSFFHLARDKWSESFLPNVLVILWGMCVMLPRVLPLTKGAMIVFMRELIFRANLGTI
jgi:hypothetical protein